jgi:ElaB/YqjD/DUF883 family membrane-anchored ribosome-binding protein
MTTQDPDQIRDGIEQTQRELSADVDALTARLSPQRIVQDQAQRARTVTAAARRGIQANPVAAVLIALGAGWLIAVLLPSPGRTPRPARH